jgi:hypothetical protein
MTIELYYTIQLWVGLGWVGLGHDILEIHFNIGNDNRVILYYSVMGWVGLGWVGLGWVMIYWKFILI